MERGGLVDPLVLLERRLNVDLMFGINTGDPTSWEKPTREVEEAEDESKSLWRLLSKSDDSTKLELFILVCSIGAPCSYAEQKSTFLHNFFHQDLPSNVL